MIKARFIERSINANTSFNSNESNIRSSFGDYRVITEKNVLVATTEEWNSQIDLIGEKDLVYVYTDHAQNEEGQPVPGFKVGDGLAYLIDLPFNDDLFFAHVANSSVHVTEEEREFWNNKVTAFLNAMNPEELILTKD